MAQSTGPCSCVRAGGAGGLKLGWASLKVECPHGSSVTLPPMFLCPCVRCAGEHSCMGSFNHRPAVPWRLEQRPCSEPCAEDPPPSTVPPAEGQSPADPALEVDRTARALHGGTARARSGAQWSPTQGPRRHPGERVLCQVGRTVLLALLLGEGAAGEAWAGETRTGGTPGRCVSGQVGPQAGGTLGR